MKIFVTGATGVIGRRVVPRLIQAGHQVTAVARTTEKRRALSNLGANAIAVNLFDRPGVERAVAGHDTIINLATHIPPSIPRMFLRGSWRENDRIRREASANLVDAAVATRAARFIQESYAPIYAPGDDRWLDESWPAKPARYNRSVLDAEHSAARFTSNGGAGVVLRFANFYGPDDFAIAMIDTVKKGWSPIPGSADAYFSSVAHDDAASAVRAALGARAGVYNIADDEPLRRRDYVGAIADMLDVVKVRYTPNWLARMLGSLGELLTRSQRISNAKFKEETGWRPQYPSAKEGWRDVIASLGRGS